MLRNLMEITKNSSPAEKPLLRTLQYLKSKNKNLEKLLELQLLQLVLSLYSDRKLAKTRLQEILEISKMSDKFIIEFQPIKIK